MPVATIDTSSAHVGIPPVAEQEEESGDRADAAIELVLRRRRSTAWGRSAREMHRLFVEHAHGGGASRAEPVPTARR